MTMTFTPTNNTAEFNTAKFNTAKFKAAGFAAPAGFTGQRSPRPVRVAAPAPSTSGASINSMMAVLLGALIIIGFVTFGGDAAANSPAVPASADSEFVDAIEIYIVQPGDTLFGIASELARPGEDVRPIVDELKNLTGGSALDVGQRIIIDHSTIRG